MCDMGKIQSSALEIHKAVTVSYRLFPRPMEAALLVDWSAVSAVCVYSFFFKIWNDTVPGCLIPERGIMTCSR